MIHIKYLAIVLLFGIIAISGCGVDNSQNGKYLDLFEQFWSKDQQGALFNLEVAAVTDGPEGWKQVTISYSHGIGENYPSQENQAAMLVSPDGKTFKKCIFDLSSGLCLGNIQPDWTYQP